MKTRYSIIILTCAALSTLRADTPSYATTFLSQQEASMNTPHIKIHNRPLAKINGKTISLYDVIKKMDVMIHEYAPDADIHPAEHYQFYMNRWQHTLDEMIANELILMDASQKEMHISDGEVRETLQERFGPNVRENLEKMHLEYDEARDMIRTELTINQLLGMKVHVKAFHLVTPEMIKHAYEEYTRQHPAEEYWTYQVLSIRGSNEACQALTNKAADLLNTAQTSLAHIQDSLSDDTASINVSEEFSLESKKISKAHFEVLQTLTPGSISAPVSQLSRFDQSTVVRMFHLKDVQTSQPETFDQMYDSLKNQLLFKTAEQEKNAYVDTLRKRFGYASHDAKLPLPNDYQPFEIF